MITVNLNMSLPTSCPRCPFYRGGTNANKGCCILKGINHGDSECRTSYDIEYDCPLLNDSNFEEV